MLSQGQRLTPGTVFQAAVILKELSGCGIMYYYRHRTVLIKDKDCDRRRIKAMEEKWQREREERRREFQGSIGEWPIEMAYKAKLCTT